MEEGGGGSDLSLTKAFFSSTSSNYKFSIYINTRIGLQESSEIFFAVRKTKESGCVLSGL